MQEKRVFFESRRGLGSLKVNRESGIIDLYLNARIKAASTLEYEQVISAIRRLARGYEPSLGYTVSETDDIIRIAFPPGGIADAPLLGLVETLHTDGIIDDKDYEKTLQLLGLNGTPLVYEGKINQPVKESIR